MLIFRLPHGQRPGSPCILSALPDRRPCFNPGVIRALVVMGLGLPSLSLMKKVFQPIRVVFRTVSPCAVCISITFSWRSVQFSKEDVDVEVALMSTISAHFIVVLDSLPTNAHSSTPVIAFAACSDILIISACLEP
jgi:hypothetical protein